MGGGVDRFNAFLESGARARDARRDSTLQLWVALVIASALPALLSRGLGALASSSAPTAVAASAVTLLVGMLASNAAFALFSLIPGSKKVSLGMVPWGALARTLPAQVFLAIVVGLAQGMALAILGSFAGSVPQLGLLCTVVVALVASLVTAGAVFQLVDSGFPAFWGLKGVMRVPHLLACSSKMVIDASPQVAKPAFLFITWSMAAGLISAFPQVANSEYLYNGLIALNYLVAGYLEIDLLAGLSLRWDELKDHRGRRF